MPADRTIIEIPLELLHDSPFNPPDRATLRIDEMAATIRSAGGILSALLVRPRTGDDVEGGYEVVFGHRRKYGGLAAGLATAPCEVRALTDAEARELQAIENLQRENLKALEEAASYQSMITADGLSRRQVATAIGKSESHVAARLRLLDLCPQVREALTTGEIKSEVALLIARVGDEKMQGKALAAIKGKYWDLEDGGAKSYRQIRELLNEKFTLELDKAIFPITSAELVPSAGSCTDCVKRTGNAPEFADVTGFNPAADVAAQLAALEDKIDACTDDEERAGLYDQAEKLEGRDGAAEYVRHGGPNVCTDPDCFEAKKKAHLKAEAARLESEGATVIAGGKARQAINARGELGDGYVVAAKIDLAKAKTEVKPVTIQDPRNGTTVQAYRAEDLAAAGVKVKAPKAKKSSGYDPKAWEEQRRRDNARAAEETKARRAILEAVREKAASAERSLSDLRIMAHHAVATLEYGQRELLMSLYDSKSMPALLKSIEDLDAAACALLLLDCAITADVDVDAHSMQQKPQALLAAAAHYGIDPDAVRQGLQTSADEPARAAPAKKTAKGRKATTTTEQPELI